MSPYADVKYQGTYYGHRFVARLASDNNVIVDYISFEPTKIKDCADPIVEEESNEQQTHPRVAQVETTLNGGSISISGDSQFNHSALHEAFASK